MFLIEIDEKTVRKWLWIFVFFFHVCMICAICAHYIFALLTNQYHLIKLRSHSSESDFYGLFVSVDMAYFVIEKQKPFTSTFYTRKHYGAGARYATGLSRDMEVIYCILCTFLTSVCQSSYFYFKARFKS